jgi:Tfp pilus assembly protein PilN
MPNINLIAARREEKKRLERTTRQLFFGVAGSLGVLMTLSLYLGAQRLEANGNLHEIETRMAKLQPVLDEIARVKKDTDELTPKVATLRDAKAGTQKWRAVLQVVSGAVPRQTWLSGMSATGTGDDTTINLTGVSGSQALVGETMTRLGAHPLFDKVELRYTQAMPPQSGAHGASAENPRFTFEINAHLRGAPKPEVKDPQAAPGGGKAAQSAPGARKEGGNA